MHIKSHSIDHSHVIQVQNRYQTQSNLLFLPDDVFPLIGSYLTHQEKRELMLVSRKFLDFVLFSSPNSYQSVLMKMEQEFLTQKNSLFLGTFPILYSFCYRTFIILNTDRYSSPHRSFLKYQKSLFKISLSFAILISYSFFLYIDISDKIACDNSRKQDCGKYIGKIFYHLIFSTVGSIALSHLSSASSFYYFPELYHDFKGYKIRKSLCQTQARLKRSKEFINWRLQKKLSDF